VLVRKFRKTDIPLLREIHEKAGYGFPFPKVGEMEISFVAEEDGKPIGFVGAELRAEITGMFDPAWGSPHERMKLFAGLHLPVAEALEIREVKVGYCFRDPKFPRFGERLRELGWAEAWTCYWMNVKDCIKALRRRA
jgi:hypothetical protein